MCLEKRLAGCYQVSDTLCAQKLPVREALCQELVMGKTEIKAHFCTAYCFPMVSTHVRTRAYEALQRRCCGDWWQGSLLS